MQILRGKGQIFDIHESYIGKVKYYIEHKATNENDGGEWRGEITPDNGIILTGNYIIELEDRRKGTCIVGMKTTSSFGLVFDSFSVEGTGPLTL